ncbi:hypothetical protein [Streptomyces sp. NRRL WC-3742]|uniref:hypothetical protein n=1 Tax=Streptomyces sp. NRRL WC-3742 TaxID=1463934 RepID=UPI00069082CD|nr:hypothetical protein [Streptomyces sp. NRRL WC-3742]
MADPDKVLGDWESKPPKPVAPSEPGGSADDAPYLLESQIVIPMGVPIYGGTKVNVAPVVSTGQTDTSAKQLVDAFGKHDVKVEIDTLTTFAKKIEALLLAMEGSPAAPYKVQQQKVEGVHLGEGFTEATALTGAYDKVHKELARLHKDFASQIQAMKESVSKSAGRYAANEDHTTAAQKAVAANTGGSASKPTEVDL